MSSKILNQNDIEPKKYLSQTNSDLNYFDLETDCSPCRKIKKKCKPNCMKLVYLSLVLIYKTKEWEHLLLVFHGIWLMFITIIVSLHQRGRFFLPGVINFVVFSITPALADSRIVPLGSGGVILYLDWFLN